MLDGLVGELRASATRATPESVQALCDRIEETAMEVGLEHDAAWRVLAVRDELSGYLFAARSIDGLDVPTERVAGLLARGLRVAAARIGGDLP
jgi:hypothetical protein